MMASAHDNETKMSVQDSFIHVAKNVIDTNIPKNFKTKPCRAIYLSSWVVYIIFLIISLYYFVKLIRDIIETEQFWSVVKTFVQCHRNSLNRPSCGSGSTSKEKQIPSL